MSSQAIRIEAATLRRLRDRSATTGEPLVRLAQRYIEEGMRTERHPGIVFRDGPAGRRPGLLGGPDVWEVIGAMRSAPERGEARIEAVAERIGISEDKVRTAMRYYGEYPEEVDAFVELNDRSGRELKESLDRERQLLG